MQVLLVIAMLCQNPAPKQALECHKYYVSCFASLARANPKSEPGPVLAACMMHRDIK